MYKIKYLPTGHIFVLPKAVAEDLKEKSPTEYQILEKNGKKFKDKVKPKEEFQGDSILSKIVEKE